MILFFIVFLLKLSFCFIIIVIPVLNYAFICLYYFLVCFLDGKRRGRKRKYESNDLAVPVCTAKLLFLEALKCWCDFVNVCAKILEM